MKRLWLLAPASLLALILVSSLSAASAVGNVGTGQVFVPNPVQSLGDESLTDQKDSDTAVPASAYYRVALTNLDVSGHANTRRADEDAPQRGAVAQEREIGLEARDLPPVRVPVDLDVDEPEMLAVEDDHPGARPQDRTLERPDCLVQPVKPHQTHERRRFPARNDQSIQIP